MEHRATARVTGAAGEGPVAGRRRRPAAGRPGGRQLLRVPGGAGRDDASYWASLGPAPMFVISQSRARKLRPSRAPGTGLGTAVGGEAPPLASSVRDDARSDDGRGARRALFLLRLRDRRQRRRRRGESQPAPSGSRGRRATFPAPSSRLSPRGTWGCGSGPGRSPSPVRRDPLRLAP